MAVGNAGFWGLSRGRGENPHCPAGWARRSGDENTSTREANDPSQNSLSSLPRAVALVSPTTADHEDSPVLQLVGAPNSAPAVGLNHTLDTGPVTSQLNCSEHLHVKGAAGFVL